MVVLLLKEDNIGKLLPKAQIFSLMSTIRFISKRGTEGATILRNKIEIRKLGQTNERFVIVSLMMSPFCTLGGCGFSDLARLSFIQSKGGINEE